MKSDGNSKLSQGFQSFYFHPRSKVSWEEGGAGIGHRGLSIVSYDFLVQENPRGISIVGNGAGTGVRGMVRVGRLLWLAALSDFDDRHGCE